MIEPVIRFPVALATEPESAELALLRRHEPILAFTQGEMFFPTSAGTYVRNCSLVASGEGAARETIVERGAVDLELLAEIGSQASTSPLSLRFVENPLGGSAYHHWLSNKPVFKAEGRLARTGLIGRFADAMFQLTLLLRGTVPGGTTAQAQVQYAALRNAFPRDVYYGRVLQSRGYVVLHYLFLYAMNDWRSSFYGVNDHEADWEQVFVYLTEADDGSLEPAWLACASHDYFGADLRRRWDDSELTIHDGHPVVFAGAGSHACYFQRGEYLTRVRPRFLKPLSDVTAAIARFWRGTLGQGSSERLVRSVEEAIAVPYIDYARGDGIRIGPDESREWTPILIDDSVPWVTNYAGLWGLDTGDVFGGERAPAGPRYNRDGTVRRSWSDPVGWVELDLEPLPENYETELSRRIDSLQEEKGEIGDRAALVRDGLSQLSVETRSLDGIVGLKSLARKRNRQIKDLEEELERLVAEEDALDGAILACRRLQARARAGYRPGSRDHIRHAQTPEPPRAFREGRIAEYWAAASAGLLLILLAVFFALGAPWFTVAVLLVTGFVLVDSLLRGALVGLLLNAAIVLAVITAVVLAYEFFWAIAFAVIAASGVLVIAKNTRELRFLRLKR